MGGPIGQLEAPVQWTGDIGEPEGPDPPSHGIGLQAAGREQGM